jgi:hypothetical protein
LCISPFFRPALSLVVFRSSCLRAQYRRAPTLRLPRRSPSPSSRPFKSTASSSTSSLPLSIYHEQHDGGSATHRKEEGQGVRSNTSLPLLPHLALFADVLIFDSSPSLLQAEAGTMPSSCRRLSPVLREGRRVRVPPFFLPFSLASHLFLFLQLHYHRLDNSEEASEEA